MPGSTTAAGVAHHDQSTTGLTLLHGELPFGYLKASVATGTVSLFVLPFNFPRLWPLLGNGFSCVCCVCECVRCVHELHGELPFGYLKASVATGIVSLFVLPFNFPRLWPLLGKFVRDCA